MTPSIDTDPQKTVSELLPFLKEYTEKLGNLAEKARKLKVEIAARYAPKNALMKAERDNLFEEFQSVDYKLKRLSHPANELARVASQNAEHAKLTTALRLELGLRLAELEGVMNDALSIGPPS